MNRIIALSVAAVAALVLVACGSGTDSSSPADRTVEVTMKDILFEPKTVTVKKGETVRFVFRNSGQLDHDAFIGDTKAQQDHEEDMRKGDKDGGHDDGHGDDEKAVTVVPGKTAELTHTFDKVGTMEIGCHQAGHYEAGMKVTIEVTA